MTLFGMQLSKVFRIAGREFRSTALTKGFIIGALVVPAAITAIMPLVVILAEGARPDPDQGRLLVLDRTESLVADISENLSEEMLAERARRKAEQIGQVAEGMLGKFGEQVAGSSEQALKQIPVPSITVESLPLDADPDEQKQRVRDQLGSETADEDRVLGFVEIDSNAVVENDAGELGGWQPYYRPKLNPNTSGEVYTAINDAIKAQRFTAAGLDQETIDRLNSIAKRDSQEITAEGERSETAALSMILPAGLMLLILIAVFTGGQYLLTTTIEEKSSRVVEVLLSAVSPLELMTGKILGQMAVGSCLLIVYTAVGLAALIALALTDLISPMALIFAVVFFVLAYFTLASLMAAIGAAVNDLREAQSLQTPVIMTAMVPYLFFMPVIQAPNSTLSTSLSMIPPFGSFVMVMRVASNDPPPLWEILLSMGIMAAGAMFSVWLAAKVFRVGLLMFGKPPNLKTLIKWVRMA